MREEGVHRARTAGEHRPQLLAIHQLGDAAAGCGQPGGRCPRYSFRCSITTTRSSAAARAASTPARPSRRPRPPDGTSGGRSPRPVRCPPACRTPDRLPATGPPPPVGRAAGSSGAPGGPRPPVPEARGCGGTAASWSPRRPAPSAIARWSVVSPRGRRASRSRPAAPRSGRL